jgi:hypothetical protein
VRPVLHLESRPCSVLRCSESWQRPLLRSGVRGSDGSRVGSHLYVGKSRGDLGCIICIKTMSHDHSPFSCLTHLLLSTILNFLWNTCTMVSSTLSTSEKPDLAEVEAGNNGGMFQGETTGRQPGDVALQASALPQFAHLDEKKILRKVGCIR